MSTPITHLDSLRPTADPHQDIQSLPASASAEPVHVDVAGEKKDMEAGQNTQELRHEEETPPPLVAGIKALVLTSDTATATDIEGLVATEIFDMHPLLARDGEVEQQNSEGSEDVDHTNETESEMESETEERGIFSLLDDDEMIDVQLSIMSSALYVYIVSLMDQKMLQVQYRQVNGGGEAAGDGSWDLEPLESEESQAGNKSVKDFVYDDIPKDVDVSREIAFMYEYFLPGAVKRGLQLRYRIKDGPWVELKSGDSKGVEDLVGVLRPWIGMFEAPWRDLNLDWDWDYVLVKGDGEGDIEEKSVEEDKIRL
ncbi:hypothetical protein B7494_g622 [Chlorociboria aeruginascens]|nr:hypothetical protein B7494_g622 [Chlorociboria aeruginascens]